MSLFITPHAPSSTSSSHLLLLRHALLLQLNAAYPASLPSSTLSQGLHIAGHNLTPLDLLRELTYLKEKSLVEVLCPLLNPAEPRYKLTASGEDYLRTQALV